MNFSFRFQVVGMDVVETDFEMISLAAATANVLTFLMLKRVEGAAMPEDTAAKSREETPTEGWRAGLTCSTTEWGAAAAGGTAAAALVVALGGTNTRSGNGMVEVAFIAASTPGKSR